MEEEEDGDSDDEEVDQREKRRKKRKRSEFVILKIKWIIYQKNMLERDKTHSGAGYSHRN